MKYEVTDECPYLADIVLVCRGPYEPGHSEQMLAYATDEEERRQIQCELAYMRGDFQTAKESYYHTTRTSKTRISALLAASGAAVSTNDYGLFQQVCDELEKLYQQYCDNPLMEQLLWLALQIVYSSLYLGREPFDVSRVSLLPAATRCHAMIYYMKYMHLTQEFGKITGIGETALAMNARSEGIFQSDEYLHIMCAIGYHELHQEEETYQHIKAALTIGVQDGFITPICEHITALSGRLGQYIEQHHVDFYRPIMQQCEATINNWISMHNRYAKDNITSILTVPELQVATLATRGKTNAEIAKMLNYSIAYVKKALESVFAKLLITKRSELDQYIIWSPEKK
ncbi:MAG TPA: LuxR C-terminal-related transcriptional regulator [Lachnospiraceae bacterium]|jgi:DNA-binding CsgD family transcriptional regulator|nr:LuxR C-terminal-related transcriptional regulator [Lachnospiraceae bacterium]